MTGDRVLASLVVQPHTEQTGIVRDEGEGFSGTRGLDICPRLVCPLPVLAGQYGDDVLVGRALRTVGRHGVVVADKPKGRIGRRQRPFDAVSGLDAPYLCAGLQDGQAVSGLDKGTLIVAALPNQTVTGLNLRFLGAVSLKLAFTRHSQGIEVDGDLTIAGEDVQGLIPFVPPRDDKLIAFGDARSLHAGMENQDLALRIRGSLERLGRRHPNMGKRFCRDSIA